MTLPRLHPSPTGTLVGVAALLFAVLLGSARPSAAQTEGRYVLGETVGLSSGVYLGTERRGSYLLTLLGGLATTVVVVGVGGDVVGSDADPLTLAAVPVLQLAITIPIAQSD